MATPTATFLVLMATALSAQERVLLDSMSSELRFILSEFEIPDRIRLRAVEPGYKSLARFAVLGDDRPPVRALIATDFLLNAQEPNLDADLALQARLLAAQNVHSKLQIRASGESGGSGVLQCSQVGRSASMSVPIESQRD